MDPVTMAAVAPVVAENAPQLIQTSSNISTIVIVGVFILIALIIVGAIIILT